MYLKFGYFRIDHPFKPLCNKAAYLCAYQLTHQNKPIIQIMKSLAKAEFGLFNVLIKLTLVSKNIYAETYHNLIWILFGIFNKIICPYFNSNNITIMWTTFLIF
ncbi:hypothetical protein CDG68_08525 [Acinetobacter wuhouensis]|uniref:Uncharacterized protein n=1 Tax=Acinetobacter wuhouensis TaxID=1879050 RepID=A0A3G2T0L8_9GAMM|nr:hypothetical protein CDG68_08525 [Acinetobacter wuhouensis]